MGVPQLPILRLAPWILMGAVVSASVWVYFESRSNDANHRTGGDAVAHVHALAIDASDTVYAATHRGLYRIEGDGTTSRVGESYQDTMGFIVVGAGHFLGSGHPDVAGRQAGQPPLLGLIESTNGGASWSAISLSGEADFHGLDSANGTIFGWDSSTRTFMTSADRRTWDRRSEIDLYGFVVDREQVDLVIGAAPDGIVRSTDGGRTWSVPTSPQLVALTDDDRGDLWGADASGAVWTSVDGVEWSASGAVHGEPTAIAAQDDQLWIAVLDDDRRTSIRWSTDQGGSWTVVYEEPSPVGS